MKELIVASRNKGKVKEIMELLEGLPFKVSSLLEYPDLPDVVEDGKTYKENALKKAITIAKITGKMTMSDDSGLEVAALNNAPGIYSARFAGEGKSEADKNQKLFRMLKGVPLSRRQCRYRCVIALSDGKGRQLGVVQGTCGGVVALKERGTHGFGFDPLFIVPRYNQTFGELDSSIKAKISHRARALVKFRQLLEKTL
ncbi:MAG: XTP/dITP diphosphatase [Candidatus Omnitrophica bacterium]|nr:XTP/dITP diphosphatase [Candidatus Omnitrophota bacterium]